eukprot:TRINITY_DN50305_c0_g1_i1.p1 TRINITY_DN50305_c0_g1~~TRINITY_DN50305_c0_g1_i1.p1  ORF type:complete len:423 (+),score=28.47 TRINITY_DN50305_c0_g1_i1:3-1271(+)
MFSACFAFVCFYRWSSFSVFSLFSLLSHASLPLVRLTLASILLLQPLMLQADSLADGCSAPAEKVTVVDCKSISFHCFCPRSPTCGWNEAPGRQGWCIVDPSLQGNRLRCGVCASLHGCPGDRCAAERARCPCTASHMDCVWDFGGGGRCVSALTQNSVVVTSEDDQSASSTTPDARKSDEVGGPAPAPQSDEDSRSDAFTKRGPERSSFSGLLVGVSTAIFGGIVACALCRLLHACRRDRWHHDSCQRRLASGKSARVHPERVGFEPFEWPESPSSRSPHESPSRRTSPSSRRASQESPFRRSSSENTGFTRHPERPQSTRSLPNQLPAEETKAEAQDVRAERLAFEAIALALAVPCDPCVRPVAEQCVQLSYLPVEQRRRVLKDLMVEYHPDKNQDPNAKDVFQYVNSLREGIRLAAVTA